MGDLQVVKGNLDAKVMQLYKTDGLVKVLEVANHLLKIQDPANKQKKSNINGEICELVLRTLTLDYLKSRKLTGSVFHSMILRNLDQPDSNFRTELDFTLLTPSLVLTGECKSYYGNIQIMNEGLLCHTGRDSDVYKQSKLHSTQLTKYLKRLVKPGQQLVRPRLGIFCFIFSYGKIEDLRTPENKKVMPILSIKTLYAYYDRMVNKCPELIYNYELARKLFQKQMDSQSEHEAHRRFLGY